MSNSGIVKSGDQVSMLATSSNSSSPNASRFAVGIGGLSMGAWCEKGMPVGIDPEHQPFLCAAPADSACDIELDVYWSPHFELPKSTPAFVSGGLWSAYTHSTGTKFYFCSSTLCAMPYKAAWFDENFERGHIVLNRSCFVGDDAVLPLEYPIDELVMMHRLALGEGVEVHALGLVDHDGAGYLFLGHSGAGKSTTARLWMEQPGVQLLSDDRIILRKHEGKFWMYGTPWHGDAGVASAGRAPLSAVFLLEQAPNNELAPIATSKAAAELFARAFVPHYLKSGIHFTLDFLDQITRSVPCSILRFTPTSGAVEAVRYARV